MADPQLSAPEPASPETPRAGVLHVRHRHTDRFTVIGNHLAQHPGLSLVAIGLAVHIQSLPDGAPVTAKALTQRFREGEITIRRALNELVAAGYLERRRVRLGGGRIATRTLSYDRPGCGSAPRTTRPDRPGTPGEGVPGQRPAARGAAPLPPRAAACRSTEPPPASPSPACAPPMPRPAAQPPSARPREPRSACTAPPSLPGLPPGLRPAAEVLAGLRRHDPRLLLPERDVHRLAPLVGRWLSRGTPPDQVVRALTGGLPAGPLRHPAGLVGHRLTALLPPPLPSAPVPRPRPHPLENCDGCDRAFRTPTPGALCADCRATGAEAA